MLPDRARRQHATMIAAAVCIASSVKINDNGAH